MHIDFSSGPEVVVLRLSGRFDFNHRDQFLPHIDAAVGATAPAIRIDMAEVVYIDSAALGMLLMLRDMARKRDKTVILMNVQDCAREALDMAQFGRLFTIA